MARSKKHNLSAEELLEQALVPEDEQPYEVPANWFWTRLGHVTTVVGGGTPSSSVPVYYENGEIPWISPVDLSRYTDMYISKGRRNITQQGLANSSAKLMPKGTVLLSSRAPIGYVAIAENELCTNQGFKSFLPSPAFLSEYLYWYLIYSKDRLESYASGTTFLELSGSKVAQVEFALPPLPEQQRIVERIESLFSKLDQAKELAQSALDSFETRQAAILHKAFTGELTAKWREEHGVRMDSWGEKTFGGLGKFRLGKMLDRVKNKGELTKYLRNVNVRWFDFDLSDISEMAVTEEEKVVYSIETGDLLICEGGEPGRCAVWEQETCDLIYQKALHRFRTNGSVVTSFLAYYILFISKTDKLSQYFTGTTIKHLTGQSLAKISILLPSIPEQEEIVRILNINFKREENANDRCDIIDQINLIKKSILARAFRGELGTNDPNEESALELLNEVIVTQ